MVTAELAVGVLAVFLVLAAAVGVGVVLVGQLRCADAAYAVARAAAREAPPPGSLPSGVVASIDRDDATSVVVTVRSRVRAFGPLLPATTVQARAVAAREPGAVGYAGIARP